MSIAKHVTGWAGARTARFTRKNKFGAKRTKAGSRTFHSKGESRRADHLRLLERAGEISNLQFQTTIYLSAARIGYRPDFSYIENGRQVWEDFKGMETPEFKIKARLWAAYGPGLLRIVKASGSRFVVDREITPSPVTS